MYKLITNFYVYLILLLLYNLIILVIYNYYNHDCKLFVLNEEFYNKYHKNIPLFLIIFTSNIFEETVNFYLTSLFKFKITNFIFISLDYQGCNLSQNILPNVFVSRINQNITEHIDYNTPLYWNVVYSKTDYVKALLENKYNVILCDSDLIFFKDPREYIFKYTTDLVASCDHKCPVMNSGF